MPDRTPEAPAAKRPERILLVDDERSLVDGIVRQFRKEFNMVPAGGAEEGLRLLESEGPFAVVVSDYRMPGMDGIQFLATVRERSPDSVRVMLTGQADFKASIDAVNEGRIFRFLTKPCPPDVLSKTFHAAIDQYRLITAERELLQRTLRGSIKVLTDILALASPAAFGRAMRLRERARRIAASLGAADPWIVELAAMLSHIGCVTMPTETVEKMYQGKQLNQAEAGMVERYPQVGHDLIANIPRLEAVAKIVAYQQKRYSGSGPPDDGVSGNKIPLGARILKLLLDFDVLETQKIDRMAAMTMLRNRAGWYDSRVFAALETLVGAPVDQVVLSVSLSELKPGTTTVDDVRSESGVLVLARGQEITEPLLERLRHFAQSDPICEPIRVTVPTLQRIPAAARHTS
jgi:response regulator RpfG family c-di-GMP phosphodiesterase